MAKLQLEYNELDTRGRQDNPSYISIIHSTRTEVDSNTGRIKTPINVELQLPEQFNFSLATAYQQPFAQSMVRKSITDVSAMLGFSNFVTQAMTLQVWQGTSEVQFTMTFELMAVTDAVKDVIQPLKDLLYLMLPGRDAGPGGFLSPPGPSINTSETVTNLFSGAKGAIATYKNEISLQIGQFLRFDSVVIESVNHTFDSHFDYRGLPLGANVDIGFKTFVVPVREDIDKMFYGGSSQSARGGNTGTRGGF